MSELETAAERILALWDMQAVKAVYLFDVPRCAQTFEDLRHALETVETVEGRRRA